MRYEINGDLTKVQTTFFEFVEMSNNTSRKDEWGSGCIIDKADSFYGNMKSYGQMYDACYSGLNVKKMSKVRASLNSLLNHEVETPRKAVVGETLNVGAFCAGHPYHFYKDADEYGKPRVHIAYSTNAVAGVTSSQFIRHGAALCSLVDQIADQVDVKISLYITNTSVFTGKGCQIVTIKDYDEVIDVPRVAATAHPSFFRRIGFAWFENAKELIDESCSQGWGGPQTGSQRKYVINDEEFSEWLGVANDEMLIDFPAPDEDHFKDDKSTAYWLERAATKIENDIADKKKTSKLFGGLY